jgi:hypothetical protein
MSILTDAKSAGNLTATLFRCSSSQEEVDGHAGHDRGFVGDPAEAFHPLAAGGCCGSVPAGAEDPATVGVCRGRPDAGVRRWSVLGLRAAATSSVLSNDVAAAR